MDTTIQEPFNQTYDDVDRLAKAYVETLISQVLTDLKNIESVATGDDKLLGNCWDDICVHQQSEGFTIWAPYQMTIEGVVEGCFDALPTTEKQYVNFAALQNTDIHESDYSCIYEDDIIEFVYKKVMERALNDTNPRVEAFLDPCYEREDNNAYNAEEYLLLRIDPARREDFLKMLELFAFVENVEIDEQSSPQLFDLLDSIGTVGLKKKEDELDRL